MEPGSAAYGLVEIFEETTWKNMFFLAVSALCIEVQGRVNQVQDTACHAARNTIVRIPELE